MLTIIIYMDKSLWMKVVVHNIYTNNISLWMNFFVHNITNNIALWIKVVVHQYI
jgi:hypothetical protein